MEKLTIEQKAKAYDEAIKVARSKIKNDKDHVLYEEDITDIFPVLAESEDEEIRKAAIAFVKASDHFGYHLGISKEKVIAWLENQGENHIVGNNEMVKPIDKVEPKFKVGDSIKTTNEELLTITKIDEKGYWSKDLLICSFDDAAKWELVEQKPAWSEEDEAGLGDALWAIQQARAIAKDENDMGNLWYAENWLKSLKDRVQPKQEWSEDDEQYLLVCKNALRKYQVTDKWDSNIISQWLDNKLKSLRPQSTWKPSDEQIEILEHFVRSIGESGYASPYDNNTKLLYSLLSDLKKLKG